MPTELLHGSLRTSTVLLSVLFAAVLALYLAVRPPTEDDAAQGTGGGSEERVDTAPRTEEQDPPAQDEAAPDEGAPRETTPREGGSRERSGEESPREDRSSPSEDQQPEQTAPPSEAQPDRTRRDPAKGGRSPRHEPGRSSSPAAEPANAHAVTVRAGTGTTSWSPPSGEMPWVHGGNGWCMMRGCRPACRS